MLVTVEYLVKKSSDVQWWDHYLETADLSEEEQQLKKLLPLFKEKFYSGQDLVTIQTTDIDSNTRLIQFVTTGATLENAQELYVWQLYRYADLRPLVQWRSKYQKNYLSVSGPAIKYQTQS